MPSDSRPDLAIPALLAFSVGIGLLTYFVFLPARERAAPAWAEEAYEVETPAGPLLLVMEESSADIMSHAAFAALYRPATGERLVRASVPLTTSFVAATPEGLWFTESDLGLHRRDPATLKVQLTEKDWRPKARGLEGELLPSTRPRWDEGERAVLLKRTDGHQLWLDLSTLEARPAPDDASARGPRVAATRLDHASVSAGVYVDAALKPIRRAKPPQVHAGGDLAKVGCGPADSGASYLQPHAWVELGPASGRGASLVFSHLDKLGAGGRLLLTRADCAGEVWSVPLADTTELAGGLIEPEVLLLFTRRPGVPDEAWALGLADGQVRWHQAL